MAVILSPISRKKFIKVLKDEFGYSDPEPAGNHSKMRKEGCPPFILVNSHKGDKDIEVKYLKEYLKQLNISQEDWKKAVSK